MFPKCPTDSFPLFPDNASVNMEEVDERVINMYKEVKTILSRYRSGKLPKAFKIIPALSNWEQVYQSKFYSENLKWSGSYLWMWWNLPSNL